MIEVLGWCWLALAALALANAYRHTARSRRATFWGGASAAGQACLACGGLALAAGSAVPSEHPSPLVWGIAVVGVSAFRLGLWLEQRARRDAARPEMAEGEAARPPNP